MSTICIMFYMYLYYIMYYLYMSIQIICTFFFSSSLFSRYAFTASNPRHICWTRYKYWHCNTILVSLYTCGLCMVGSCSSYSMWVFISQWLDLYNLKSCINNFIILHHIFVWYLFDATISCIRKASLRKHCPPKLRTVFNRSFSWMKWEWKTAYRG